MADFPSEVDVAVIGAGAAGIAAGAAAGRRGPAFGVVLEARERAGGRTWTKSSRTASRCDLGGEWLHSADRNVLAPLAERAGFALYKRRPEWTTRLRHSGASPEEEADWIARARGALLGDPPRRAGARGPPGLDQC